jgi:hydroxyethylthiazole kinase-like uncharacterized protein yjeF
MNEFNTADLKKLYVSPSGSHKGKNGKLMVIGGSVLFHAASLWSLKIASRIVDMVFYSSVDSNNEIVQKEKHEFRDGIVVPRDKIENYINEADVILIGPGLPREEGIEEGDDDTKFLTENLLSKYKNKKWVIDGGSLQVINPLILPETSIITPHHQEFKTLFNLPPLFKNAEEMARRYNITILLKGGKDYVANNSKIIEVSGGNAGMTKGGTGDVLAGLVAALYCKNDAFLSACAASYINKKAGESLYKKTGLYFNSSDLADEIPAIMKKLL